MIKKSLNKYGITGTTTIISGLCILISVIITTTIWTLSGQSGLCLAIVVAIICPAALATPVTFFYSQLSESLDKSSQHLEMANKKLKVALSEVKELSGLLPICASCKNVRDDQGYWNQIETYIQHHSKAKFSHCVCPDCSKAMYPELHNSSDDI
jgi:hypothetical protein